MKKIYIKIFKILITRKLPEKIEKKLEESYSIIKNKTDKQIAYRELKKVENIDVLIPCISDTIDASIIKSAKRLKLISNFGNGVDNLDLITARDKNILVTNTPDVLTEDTADDCFDPVINDLPKNSCSKKKNN